MRKLNHNMNNQNGSTLIIVMLVLVAVTAVGLTALNISNTEMNMAGNDKWQKSGFYNGDPGAHGAPPVIYANLNPETEAPLPGNNPGNPGDQSCLQYINGFTPANFYNLVYSAETPVQPNTYANKDISLRACNILADIDITPRGSQALSGGGVEFASRSEGTGISGSEAKLYRIISTGDGAANSTYTVNAHYRWVEIGGGLR